MSSKRAHQWLKACRQTGRDYIDLSNSQEYDWRSWLASRGVVGGVAPRDIVGPGVVAFEFRRLDLPDGNTCRREDFIVRQLGGLCWRLHPSGSKMSSTGVYEALPCKGHLEHWLSQDEGSTLQAAHQAPRQGHEYAVISQSDTVSARATLAYVTELIRQAGRPWVANLAGQPDFKWHLFAQNIPQLRGVDVWQVGCAWDHTHGYHMTGVSRDGWQFRINLQPNVLMRNRFTWDEDEDVDPQWAPPPGASAGAGPSAGPSGTGARPNPSAGAAPSASAGAAPSDNGDAEEHDAENQDSVASLPGPGGLLGRRSPRPSQTDSAAHAQSTHRSEQSDASTEILTHRSAPPTHRSPPPTQRSDGSWEYLAPSRTATAEGLPTQRSGSSWERIGTSSSPPTHRSDVSWARVD